MAANKIRGGARPVAKKQPASKRAAASKKPVAIKKPAATKKAAAKKPAAAKKAAAKKPAAAKKAGAAKTPAVTKRPAAAKKAAAKKAAPKRPALSKKPVAKKPAAKKPVAKKRPAAKQRAVPAGARRPAAEAYGGQVAEIIAARPRDSSYRPAVERRLAIVRRRQPLAEGELSPDERAQLGALWHPTPLGEALADDENEVEVAEVVDEQGALKYRLYGWNYGVGYLMPPSGYEVVAFGAQHDLEHWHLGQRELFFAMDRAFRAKGHGFCQPLSFCWWRDECWGELEGKEHGKVGSEPYLRAKFAAVAAVFSRGEGGRDQAPGSLRAGGARRGAPAALAARENQHA